VLVRDTPANMEVIGDAGLSFSDADELATLVTAIQWLDTDDAELERLRLAAARRVRQTYSWDRITDQYEALFGRLANAQAGADVPR